MFDFWLLGINARNLDYVKRFNPRKSIRLADDKNRTKRFLSARGIPVGKTFAVLDSPETLRNFDFQALPDRFVTKPNRGSKGQGIMIVRKDGDGFSSGGKTFGVSEFRRRLSDVLQGEYSVTPGKDGVLVEETLVPSDAFSAFCDHGLADVRVIVFNLVPVAAMVRMPTERSGGKANLAQGWVGFGLNVADGSIESCFVERRFYRKKFPKGYAPFENRKVSNWNSILLHSSQIQLYSNLGYLALDWVITPEGPKLLEINARAWLEVQNVCGLPLKERLEKICKIKVPNPEKGVEIAQTLFNPEKGSALGEENVVYLSQSAKISFGEVRSRHFKAFVDLSREKSALPRSLEAQRWVEITVTLDHGAIVKFSDFETLVELAPDEFVIGRSAVRDFYVKPVRKIGNGGISDFFDVPEHEIRSVFEIDRGIAEISRKLNVLGIFRPRNFFEELDAFVTAEGRYDPFFRYSFPSPESLAAFAKALADMEARTRCELGNSNRLAGAFVEKIRELSLKIELIDAGARQDFDAFSEANVALFGGFSGIAKKPAFSGLRETPEGAVVSEFELIRAIREKLKAVGYPEIPVRMSSGGGSRVSVTVGEVPRVNVAEGAVVRQSELPPILEHEIGTHLVRRMNGEKTGLKLFQTGTAFHLRDEEWLAVYLSMAATERPESRDAHRFKHAICRRACGASFSELADFVREADPSRSLERVFKTCARAKRGICDTASRHKWAAFLKDKVYLDGLEKIEKWVSSGGDPKRLLIAKIKIEDLPLFE